VSTYPSVDESSDRLHRAGWSVGEYATASAWVVTGSNGESVVHAEDRTHAGAWWAACQQAQALGMLAGEAGLRCARR
jgi:hypothetical protein